MGLGEYLRHFADPALWQLGKPAAPLELRDPAFIRAQLPALEAVFERYHSYELSGWEHAPQGRALFVGNHSGGVMAPDMFALMLESWRRRGVEAASYGLAHDTVFRLGPLGRLLAKAGAVPASPENAIEALRRDAHVLVYPGGDIDAFRASSARSRVIFGRRRGFVRIALRARAPIVPVVAVGAHDGFHVLSDGAALARWLGLKRLFRVEVLPITLSFPWGLTVGPTFYLPPPVHMKLRVLPAIHFDYGPEAADDDDIVMRCREQVLTAMQDALDELTRGGGFGRKPLPR